MSFFPPKPRKLSSSLNRPADPLWAFELGFHPAARDRLCKAFALLYRASPRAEDYQRALLLSDTCLASSGSTRQRMQAYYAKGIALLRLGALAPGIAALDEALDLAEELMDLAACALLAHLAGSAERGRDGYKMATEYQSYSLGLLRLFNTDEERADPTLEFGALSALAVANFNLGYFDAADQCLDEARLLAPSLATKDPGPAALEWIAALLFRWRGQPERALRHAMAAAEAYSKDESPHSQMSLGRVSTVISDVALDLAESFGTSSSSRACCSFITLSGPYATDAHSLARATGDTAGEGLATLATLRLETLTGRSCGHIRMIEQVARAAEAENDAAVVCQALTALGRELAVKGEVESALAQYRQARALAEEHELPALGVWARRELLRYEEQHA
jgi:tetratricopeptide (TPR) repeat protein